MSYFGRAVALQKVGNPNHDALGRFASAPGGGAAIRATGYDATHHTNIAAHAVMNAIKSKVYDPTFRANEGVIYNAVKNALRNRSGLTSWGMADAIKAELARTGTQALKGELTERGTNGRMRVYSAIHEALVSTEQARGSAAQVAASVSSPYVSPGGLSTNAAPTTTPGLMSPATNAAVSSPGGGMPIGASHMAAASTGSAQPSDPVRRAGESLSNYASRVADARRASRTIAGQGVSAPTSTARAMSSPIAASVAVPAPAPPPAAPAAPDAARAGTNVRGADIKAAGFGGDLSELNEVAAVWPKVFKDQSPQAVMDTMFKDRLGNNFKVNISGSQMSGRISMNVSNNDVTITRRFEPLGNGAVTVDHSYFKIEQPSEQGDGFGKKFLGNSMDLYKKIGVTTVTVHANIDVGGYAWAKYGFVPNPTSWPTISRELSDHLNAAPLDANFTATKRESLLRILKNPDPKSMWDYADNKTVTGATDYTYEYKPRKAKDDAGKNIPMAKQTLLSSHWYGTLDLRDPATMERFNDYIGQRR